ALWPTRGRFQALDTRLGQCSGATSGRPYPRPYLLAFFGLVRRDLVRRELLGLELLWRELLARVVHDPIGPHQPAVETPKRLVDVSKELQRIDATRATGPSPGPVPSDLKCLERPPRPRRLRDAFRGHSCPRPRRTLGVRRRC